MIGLIIGLIIVGVRPEYRFLLFYILANNAVVAAFYAFSLQPGDWPYFLINMVVGDVIFAALGAPLIALRKWLKTRKSKAERDAEAELARFRSEAAARDTSGEA